MTKREKMIALVMGGSLGIFGINKLILEPIQAHSAELDTQIQKARAQLAENTRLIGTKDAYEREWQRNRDKGLSNQQADAEGQILRSLQQWALEAGLTLGNTRPGNATQITRPGARATEKDKSFMKLTYRATGTGNSMQVSRFLYNIQTAEIPVRITDVTISTKKENTNDFEVNLGVSTIFLAPDAARAMPAQSAGAQGPASRPLTANVAASAPAGVSTRPAATVAGPSTRPEARQ